MLPMRLEWRRGFVSCPTRIGTAVFGSRTIARDSIELGHLAVVEGCLHCTMCCTDFQSAAIPIAAGIRLSCLFAGMNSCFQVLETGNVGAEVDGQVVGFVMWWAFDLGGQFEVLVL